MNMISETGREIESLRSTLRKLRGKGGCPWDMEQSLDDVISYLIDEAYELLHAEKSGDPALLEEEFGDVFFLVIFIHELMLERKDSQLAELISRVHGKIISRHPHVFGSTKASSCRESIAEWERIKQSENKTDEKMPALSGIPAALPPLRKAFSIQKKAAGAGFDWPDHTGVIEKLYEEIEELKSAIDEGGKEMIKEEIGDLFFTIVNLARKLNVDSESAISASSEKFVKRFYLMEKKVRERGLSFQSMDLTELEAIWQESK
ncbi:MAG: nucleoside triphosphate pyrophosphohydrolase [Candidatus Krumholzibacteriota bacterium]|nr:nucleoside triphosphate pyrophosphohydrolase [Candidatus Krumholzibacteriota bacterium]